MTSFVVSLEVHVVASSSSIKLLVARRKHDRLKALREERGVNLATCIEAAARDVDAN